MTTFNNFTCKIETSWAKKVHFGYLKCQCYCVFGLFLDKKIQNMQRKKRVILNAQNLQ